MSSVHTEIRQLRIYVILALTCSFVCCIHAAAQTKAGGRAPGAIFRECRGCPEMVVIPAGSLIMGSSAEEKSWAVSHGGSLEAVADEAPQHHVPLQSFALGRYDVTRGEYAAFVRETGYPAGNGCGRGRAIFKWEKDPKLTWKDPGQGQTDRHPVVCVSWEDASAYIAWLNRKVHRGGATSASRPYRLPSEAEWEYAAGAAATTPVAKRCPVFFCDGGQTHPVGAKPPNAFGLYDMAGNVWQWTQDCYDNSYALAPADGRAKKPPRPTPTSRTVRENASGLIAAARGCIQCGCYDRRPDKETPLTTATRSRAFRVARTLP